MVRAVTSWPSPRKDAATSSQAQAPSQKPGTSRIGAASTPPPYASNTPDDATKSSSMRATDQYDELIVERADIERLFTFTDYGWSRYEETIRPLGDGTLTKPAPGSGWPALRDGLAHINWAYIRWLANPYATTVVASEITPVSTSILSTTVSCRRREKWTSTASRSFTVPARSSRTSCFMSASTTGT